MDTAATQELPHFGTYRIAGVLGEGGMGVVYMGVNPEGQLAAIKTPFSGKQKMAPRLHARFKREIANVRKVRSPYVAQILEASTDPTFPWFASEFIAGLTLEEAVERAGGRLSEDTVLGLAHSLRRALEDIHKHGITHRDLKPSNIILGTDGPRIIDFGIAHHDDDTRLTMDGVIGSPHYMCPEQVKNGRPQPSWDVFNLGLVLGYALTGRSLFGTSDMAPLAIAYAIGHEEPNLDDIPDSLRPLIQACLIKNPNQRVTLDKMRELLPETPTLVDMSLPEALTEVISERQQNAQLVTQTAVMFNTPPGPSTPPAGWVELSEVYEIKKQFIEKLAEAEIDKLEHYFYALAEGLEFGVSWELAHIGYQLDVSKVLVRCYPENEAFGKKAVELDNSEKQAITNRDSGRATLKSHRDDLIRQVLTDRDVKLADLKMQYNM